MGSWSKELESIWQKSVLQEDDDLLKNRDKTSNHVISEENSLDKEGLSDPGTEAAPAIHSNYGSISECKMRIGS